MTRFILAFAAFTALTADAATSYSVTVKNSWNEAKKDEPVVIRLEDKKVQSARIIRKGSSDPVPCQLDDLDGDTYPDELVFLVDIAPGETQQYSVTLSGRNEKVEAPHFASRTYADMMLEDKKNKYPKITSLEAPGESYLYNDLYHHGAAWENEVTAYRIYFDQRQNIDIYGKKLRRLELADTHFYTTPEQMKQDYGNDVLWAGNSVGCGSFKGYDGKPLNIEPVATRGQKVVATGPLRTVIQVTDKGWQHPNGSTLNMTQWYIQYAGHRETEVRITFDEPLGSETFCTGAQKYGANSSSMVVEDGLAATWGSDYPEMSKKEQFPPEFVGLAVYVPKEFVKQYKEDDLNHLFILQAKGKKELTYYVTFGADKEKDGYHSAQTWFASVAQWKEILQRPVKVTVSK